MTESVAGIQLWRCVAHAPASCRAMCGSRCGATPDTRVLTGKRGGLTEYEVVVVRLKVFLHQKCTLDTAEAEVACAQTFLRCVTTRHGNHCLVHR